MASRIVRYSFYGEITVDTALDFARFCDEARGGHLELKINSIGGTLYDGWAIYRQALLTFGTNITTFAIGEIASMAVVPFMAGRRRFAYSGDRFLFHQSMRIVNGNCAQLHHSAKDAELNQRLYVEHIAKIAGCRPDQIASLCDHGDNWVDVGHLRKLGVVTQII
jgi:ATP-dependent protease ClpP protease subunit